MMVTNDFYLEIEQEQNIVFLVSQGRDPWYMTAEEFSSLRKYVKRPHIDPIPPQEPLNSNQQKVHRFF